jgi:hypothetical protein
MTAYMEAADNTFRMLQQLFLVRAGAPGPLSAQLNAPASLARRGCRLSGTTGSAPPFSPGPSVRRDRCADT